MINFDKEPLYKDIIADYKPGLHTGIVEFDENVGGLEQGKLYILAAGTGMGKTTFMIAISNRILLENPNEKILYLATEQDASEIKCKMLSSMTGISYQDVRSGKVSDEEYDKIIEAEKKMSNTFFQYYESIKFDYESVIREAHDKGVNYVFYDYLGALVDPDATRLYAELETMADQLKRLAVELDICVFTAVQTSSNFNELTDDKLPVRLDERYLANSKGIARKGDVCFIMYRSKENSSHILLEMYKNRNKPSKRMDFAMNYATNRIFKYDRKDRFGGES